VIAGVIIQQHRLALIRVWCAVAASRIVMFLMLFVAHEPCPRSHFVVYDTQYKAAEHGESMQMFRRKPKTRLEKAREELERFSEEVQEQAGAARTEVAERMKKTVGQLRQELDHLEEEARERGKAILDNLEELAARFNEAVPEEAPTPEKSAKEEEGGIAWGLLLLAFGIGLVIGIILNNRD